MKKGLIIISLCLAFFMLPEQSQAAPTLEVVLVDSLWGAGIGGLVGGATLAFMDHPGHHLDRIYQGAAVGVICGVAFGLYEIRPMFYSYSTPTGQKEHVYGLTMNIPLNKLHF
jgi:hypothetical protein